MTLNNSNNSNKSITLSNLTPETTLKNFLNQQKTKKIILKSIELKPFRKISDLKLDFNDYSKISAPNGSGKTSIMEAIYFVLSSFGSNGKKINSDGMFYLTEVENNLNKKVKFINEKYHIELILQSNEKLYKLVRIKKNKRVKNQIFEKNSKGLWLSLGEFKVEDYYKYINSYILNLESVKFLPLFMNPTSINEYEIKDLRTLFFISLMSKINFDYSDYDQTIVENIQKWDDSESKFYISDLSKIKDITEQYKLDFIKNYDDSKNFFSSSKRIMDNLEKQNIGMFNDVLKAPRNDWNLTSVKKYLQTLKDENGGYKYPLTATNQTLWNQLKDFQEIKSQIKHFQDFENDELGEKFQEFSTLLKNENFHYWNLQKKLIELNSQWENSDLDQRIRLASLGINFDKKNLTDEFNQKINQVKTEKSQQLSNIEVDFTKDMKDLSDEYEINHSKNQSTLNESLQHLDEKYKNSTISLKEQQNAKIENVDELFKKESKEYQQSIIKKNEQFQIVNDKLINLLTSLEKINNLIDELVILDNSEIRQNAKLVQVVELIEKSKFPQINLHTFNRFIDKIKEQIGSPNPNIAQLLEIGELIAKEIISTCLKIEKLEELMINNSKIIDQLNTGEIREINKPKFLIMLEKKNLNPLLGLDESNVLEFFQKNLEFFEKYFQESKGTDQLTTENLEIVEKIQKHKSKIKNLEWLSSKITKKYSIIDILNNLKIYISEFTIEINEKKDNLTKQHHNELELLNIKLDNLGDSDKKNTLETWNKELKYQLKSLNYQYEKEINNLTNLEKSNSAILKTNYENSISNLNLKKINVVKDVELITKNKIEEINKQYKKEIENFDENQKNIIDYFQILNDLKKFKKYHYFTNYQTYLDNLKTIQFLNSEIGIKICKIYNIFESSEFDWDEIIHKQEVFDNYIQSLIIQYNNYQELRESVEENDFILHKVKEINIYLMNILQKQIQNVEDVELILNSTNKSGTLKDDFTFIHNNTSQRDLSEGEKVHIGIKISKLFQKINSLNFPILIDEVNRLSFNPKDFVQENQLITFGVGELNFDVQMFNLDSELNDDE